ncbi:E3 ISG15--protein ligase HERC5-like isoform X2 [Engraulis encrasicolus]|uniref:E3 ISG15--protein ligase HERC5-like isoform X2 n=1 Tax=Engraulis encrasicolus TaxID=184585 RepID=UPI002FD3D27E
MTLLTWGLHSLSGLTRSDELDTNDAIHFVRSKNEIKSVTVGKMITAFLRGDGKLSIIRMQELDDGSTRPGKLKNFNDFKEMFDHVSCGERTAVLIARGGRMISLDINNKLSPLAMPHNKHIAQVVCGNHHSLALCTDGQLFTWGHNSNGQLGLGKGKPSTLSPQPLNSLAGIPLSQISAGGDHSFALSLSGAVFGWGKNSAGQLGLGNKNDVPEPVQVTSLNCKKTVHISCGDEHTAVLTKDGLVFTCGSGRYGQLGHNSLRDELRPRLVAELWGAKVSQVACGRHHTLAVVGHTNSILTFGRGEQGQLGYGLGSTCSVPQYVSFPPEHTELFGKVIAGGDCSFAFCHAKSSPIKSHHLWESKCLLTLDEQIVTRWTSETNLQTWKKIMKEIRNVFSSASCINGSFVEKSFDKHFLTNKDSSGLDLSIARLAFEKLGGKQDVLTEVERVVCQDLLPSLSSRPAGVEGLRVYLILPELLRVLLKQQQGTQLAVSLAEAILRLHPDSLKALERLWSKLPGSYLRTLLKVFRKVAGKVFEDGVKQAQSNILALQPTVTVLQRVYETVRRGKRRIEDQCFRVKEFSSLGKEVQFMEKDMQPKISDVDKRDFFLNVFRELYSSNMFTQNDQETLVWFPSEPTVQLEMYFLFGVLCGLALYNKSLVHLPFPSALFRKLLNIPPTLEDLAEIHSSVAKSLQHVLEDEDVEDSELVFSIIWDNKEVELDPQEAGKPVTNSNKKQFVQAYVDYALSKSVEEVFEEFKRGFFKVCARDTVEMFHPEELQEMLVGREDYDWDILRQNAQYEYGFNESHPTMVLFWEVFNELSEDDKIAFLLFLTGFDRVPILGMKQIRMRVQVLPDSSPDHLPEALTCHSLLMLHPYECKDTLRSRLLDALHHKRGFWED